MIETNIDDMNPEIYSYVMDKLFEAKALDVFYTNIMMKKNRPALKLSVLCNKEDSSNIENIILTQTTTLGVRKYEVERSILDRDFKKVQTPLGEVTIKLAIKDNEVIKYSPEFEECKKIAIKENIPLKQVYEIIMKNI